MPNFLSKLRVGHVLRPYYYGSHKWEDYLVDIQETIADLQPNQPTDMQIQVALEAGLDDVNANLEYIGAGLEDVNANLEYVGAGIEEINTNLGGIGAGIEGVNANLTNIGTGIENLRADFQWGFTLMIARQEDQIRLFNDIVRGLDAIRGVLELPLTTKARELIALAQKDHQIGLLPEALEKFLAAEQLNKVNFPLQLQIGKLFLYGKNKQDSVIDLTKAAQHLLLAARYAGTETKWAKCRGEALFHAATAFYLIGGQETNVVNSETARQCLESALLQLRSAIDSWPVFTESYYLAAKCRVLLGQREEALEDLEILSDRDRRYFVKMGKDKDFDPVRAEAEKVFRNAITNPGFQARATQAKLSELREKLTELREEFDCFEPAEPKCREELALIEPTKALLKRATALLSKRATVSLSAIDANIEGILSGLLSVQTSLDEASRSLKEATKNAIIDCDATLRARDIGIVWPQNQLPNVMHGSFRWDPARVQLELYHLKLGHHLATDPPDFTLHSFGKLRFELGHRLVLGANVLDHLVAHPHQIPEEWQTNLLEGLPKEATFCPTSILFLGTIYTSGDCLDRLSVRSLSLSRLYKTESWKWAEFLAYQISGEPAPQVNIQKGLYVSEGTYYVALLAG